MRTLSQKLKSIHAKAVQLSQNYLRLEWEIIQILQQVEMTKLHKHFNCSSLFRYSVDVLGLSEAVSYSLITLARKAREVPALAVAIKNGKVSASKASRICAVMDLENAEALIKFASENSSKAIEHEVARRNPKAKGRDRARVLSDEYIEVIVTMKKSDFENLKRVESLEARTNNKVSLGRAVAAGSEAYLEKNDPVRKAERAQKRKSQKAAGEPATETELCVRRVYQRVDLTAEQKHAVFIKDRGCCTHLDSSGKRCNSDRWVQIHHIVPVSMGGSNDPSNLTTLCSFHHDLVHQMEMPLEGSMSRLREGFVPFRRD